MALSAESATTAGAAARRPGWVVAVMVAAQMLLWLDNSILNIAVPTLADPVAEQAGGEQQSREDERVGVDRPLQLALGGAEPGRGGRRDRLDRDVQDRVVEHHDQQTQHQDAEDRPTTPVHRFRYPRSGGDGRSSHGAELKRFRYGPVSYRKARGCFLLRFYPQRALWLSPGRSATMGSGPGTP
jgi:hypothetical protein